jgi:formate hydrogenlyase subunit 6/NADH:ubiquinone oxidoreductase subunit I
MALFSISKLVMGWSFRKPATRLYPFETRPAYKVTRGHVAIDIGKCTFCTLCEKKCPTDAIAMDKAKRTWTIDRLRCIQCSACVDACNKDCLSMENSYSAPSTAKTIDSFVQPAKDPVPACPPEAASAKPA